MNVRTIVALFAMVGCFILFVGYVGGVQNMSDSTSSDVVEINECTTIDEPGKYVLVEDLHPPEDTWECIHITSSDVVFDGQGHYINGSNLWGGVGEPSYGVLVSSHHSYGQGETLHNVTVRNVRTVDWAQGIAVFDQNSKIVNNTDIGSVRYSLYLGIDADNNLIKNNTFRDSEGSGIQLLDWSDNNRVIDNRIVNTSVGFLITHSNGNVLYGNEIEDTWHGITLENSTDTKIEHNRFPDTGNLVFSLEGSENITFERVEYADKNISFTVNHAKISHVAEPLVSPEDLEPLHAFKLDSDSKEEIPITFHDNGIVYSKNEEWKNISSENQYSIPGASGSVDPGDTSRIIALMDPKPIFEITESDFEDEVYTGENAQISVSMANVGMTKGEVEVVLKLDAEKIDSVEAEIIEGDTVDKKFEHVFDEPGEYPVQINNEEVGTITVTEADPVSEDDDADSNDDMRKDDDADSDDEPITDENGAGFGFGAVLIGLVGVLYGLQRVQKREWEDGKKVCPPSSMSVRQPL